MRAVCLLAAALALSGCASTAGEESATVAASSADVRAFAELYRQRHPDPFHALPQAEFTAARDALAARAGTLEPDALLVELMRFGALAGPRDGHTGLFVLDPAHRRPLNLYPLRLYDFPDGVHVVAQLAARRDLIGKRVVSVGGMPIAEALAKVRPLVPRDNEHSLRARAVQWLVTAEVLHGLGISDDAHSTRFGFADGTDAELEPVTAARYTAGFPDLFRPMVPQGLPQRSSPPFLRNRLSPTRLQLLGNGRAVYLAYNVTTVSTHDLAARIRKLAARPQVDRVILDLRHNPGGDNFTYPPLLTALQELPRRVRLFVLVGRTTFSAAENLAADLEQTARPRFLGEPTGGSPNLYGDTAALQLPESGWNVHVATIYWLKTHRGDRRLAIAPHEPVPYTAADFFGGRDPVLARTLR